MAKPACSVAMRRPNATLKADGDLFRRLRGYGYVPYLRECAIRSPPLTMSLHIESRAPVLAG